MLKVMYHVLIEHTMKLEKHKTKICLFHIMFDLVWCAIYGRPKFTHVPQSLYSLHVWYMISGGVKVACGTYTLINTYKYPVLYLEDLKTSDIKYTNIVLSLSLSIKSLVHSQNEPMEGLSVQTLRQSVQGKADLLMDFKENIELQNRHKIIGCL